MTKDEIKSILKEGIHTVVFTKVNGERREMPATLDPTLIIDVPKVHQTNTDNPIDFPKPRKENDAVVSVWCVDKASWRSFRIDNLIEIK